MLVAGRSFLPVESQEIFHQRPFLLRASPPAPSPALSLSFPSRTCPQGSLHPRGTENSCRLSSWPDPKEFLLDILRQDLLIVVIDTLIAWKKRGDSRSRVFPLSATPSPTEKYSDRVHHRRTPKLSRVPVHNGIASQLLPRESILSDATSSLFPVAYLKEEDPSKSTASLLPPTPTYTIQIFTSSAPGRPHPSAQHAESRSRRLG